MQKKCDKNLLVYFMDYPVGLYHDAFCTVITASSLHHYARISVRLILSDSRVTDLVIDALEILRFDFPELHLNVRYRIESFQQRLRGVFLQHLADLMRPVNDNGLDGVHERPGENIQQLEWFNCLLPLQ